MIITFFIYSMDMGGTERVTHDLINELVARGYKINLICMEKRGFFLQSLRIPQDMIYEVGTVSSIRSFWAIVFKIKKIIDISKTERIVSMGEWPNIITPFVKFNGKSLIVEHNIKTFFSAPEVYNFTFGLKLISKKAYKKAEKILCVSQNIKDILVSKCKSLGKKTSVIYNPIDFNKIMYLSGEDINYSSSKIKIINVCRLSLQKNLPLLLKAFSIVHKKNENTELWIVGDGPEKEKLKALTEKLCISDSVIFWGYQENPYKFMKNADFFVSSSDYEGFCLAIFEALYLRKRIVTTKSISDFESLITPELGRIVPINDEKSLSDAILEEIEKKNRISRIPEILEQFKLKNITDMYLDFLN
ncbi:MAG: glycosyltransferase [Treponemataceae bacterium]|nr:glycosyltransferase [Treponemataceae bacterium]